MTTPVPLPAPPPPPEPIPPPEVPEPPKPERLYVCPLAEYLAEVRRIAFGEGARWALDRYLRRAQAIDALADDVVSTAAREYAQRSR